ncbi:hypothetical protein tinsulaeT_24600 [Thalassotalea insulae]|uniref:Solute-binding protein family 3/N-terminal domain-containing protein n=1 Tax=Thalassotalea insulae TaxID=2056778 RepID=A0ABQ6GX79_9GAMM|nr:transporter substrate-binding domain-containing protein [Thalassotalea insulae]GLX79120.1 hypothetical protein tinsulaeT_24600 [Thalassotalea insulae]
MRIGIVLIFVCIFQFPAHGCNTESAKRVLDTLQWVAEDYPPYNYLNNDGEISGIFTDALLAIYRELKLPLSSDEIKVIPWARLYHLMLQKPGYAAFSMTVTEPRRQLFKLIPLPYTSNISIMVKAANKKALQDKPLNELSIAVVREDIGQHLLDSQQIKAKQILTTSAFGMLKMLIHERVDAIAYAEDVAHFQIRKLGLGKDPLVPIYILESHSINNFIFHRDIDTCAIKLFVDAIERLHQQGKIKRIIDKYLHKPL